jgi:hypothetical protein
MSEPSSLRQLLDRGEIAELVSRYGAMADEKTFDDATAILTDDVVAEYPFGRLVGIEQVAGSGRAALGRFERTQHVITNLLIDLDGDRASVRANLVSVHVPRADEPAVHFDFGGWYRFAARRTEHGWRLAGITLTAVWTAGATEGEHAEALSAPEHHGA